MTDDAEQDLIDELLADWDDQRPDLDTGPMEVVLRIQTVARAFNDKVSEKLQEFGLQWWQYDVLSALRRQGKPYLLAASELAAASMLTSGAMTNRIDRLEESGWVKRKQDEQDRRKVLVELTPQGLNLINRASEARFDVATRCLEGLNQQQHAQLSDLLRQLIHSLEE